MIAPNVHLGENVTIDPTATVGHPPRGKAAGDLPVYIGANSVIRANSVIYGGVTIGQNFQCGHGAMIRENNTIGDSCSVGTNAVLEPGNRVGSGTRIHSGCFLENAALGERVFVGPNVTFTDDPHPPCVECTEFVGGATIEDGAAIGGNSTLMPGVRVGEGALIGGGSVVTKDIPARMVAAGNPARVIKRVDEVPCRAKAAKVEVPA
jgi:acetyltransferase-like isoleucine patch superfamily enzyme